MIGGHGFVAAMVFVVALAVEVLDKKLFQGMGDTQGHVVVHLRDAERHAHGLVVAVHGTRLGLHCRIVEIDAGGEATILRYIGEQQPTETVSVQWTCLRMTDGIALGCLFCEQLFAGLWFGNFLLHGAKIAIKCDTTKLFPNKFSIYLFIYSFLYLIRLLLNS